MQREAENWSGGWKGVGGSKEGVIQLWRIQTVSVLMAMTARRAGPLEGLLRSKVLDKVRGEGTQSTGRQSHCERSRDNDPRGGREGEMGL